MERPWCPPSLARNREPLDDATAAYFCVLEHAADLGGDAMHVFFTMGGAVDRANEAVSEVAATLRQAFARGLQR